MLWSFQVDANYHPGWGSEQGQERSSLTWSLVRTVMELGVTPVHTVNRQGINSAIGGHDQVSAKCQIRPFIFYISFKK